LRFRSWFIVILACIAVAAGLGWYKYQQIQTAIARAKAFPEPMEAVVAVTAQAVEQQSGLTVSGVVVATQSAELRNELPGRIVAVGFAAGATVARGQLLIALDTTQESAQLAEAEASREIARLALERAERLVKVGAGSVEARDQANAQFAASSARAQALAASIEKKNLRAPFAGVASLHQLEPGQYLPAGSLIAALVGRGDTLWVDFALPQSDAHVSIGTGVEIFAEDLDLPPLKAPVLAQDPAVQAASRNLRMRAVLSSPPSALLPGMLVKVHVPMGGVQSLVSVPAQAVRRDGLGASVYVLLEVEEEGGRKLRASRRTVQVANMGIPDAADHLVIESGLKPGERIAASGAFKLRDGSLIQVVERDPAADHRLVGH
jgi:RND family efflux transporter MFP subunit